MMSVAPMTREDELMSFGGEHFTQAMLREMALALFRFRQGQSRGDGSTALTAIEAKRHVDEMFAGQELWSNVFALWHWSGGELASLADLWMVEAWLRRGQEYFSQFMTDRQHFTTADSQLSLAIYTALDAGGGFTAAATAITGLLGYVADEAIQYVDYDPGSGEVGDPHEVLPLIGVLQRLAGAFESGPDADGRFLPDELVWNGLAGAPPTQTISVPTSTYRRTVASDADKICSTPART